MFANHILMWYTQNIEMKEGKYCAGASQICVMAAANFRFAALRQQVMPLVEQTLRNGDFYGIRKNQQKATGDS